MKEIDYDPPEQAVERKEPEQHWGERISPLRTYGDDVAEAMRDGSMTKTKVIIAEQERRARTLSSDDGGDDTGSHILRAILITGTLFGVLFLIIAVVFFGVGQSRPNADTDTSDVAAITADEGVSISSGPKLDISEGMRPQAIADLRILSRDVPTGKNIFLLSVVDQGKRSSLRSLLQTLTGEPALDIGETELPYALALVRSSTTVAVLAVDVASYENVLSVIIQKERDFARTLSTVLDPYNETPQGVFYGQESFRDSFIVGTDARIFRRPDGREMFVWGFLDRSYLIFAPDSSSYQLMLQALREGEIFE